MGSPPKPWERTGAGPSSVASSSPSLPSTASPAATTSAQPPSSSTPPSLPERPAAFSSSTSPYSSSSYGASPYNRFGSSYGGLGSYGSGYGGYGGGLGSYGGMGSYNSFGSYGGYGGMGMGYGGMGYSGMGGMGYGAGGMPGQMQFDANGNPLPPNSLSLTQTLESTTHTTFTLLHSIVQTFTGMAQMLESTFMATHSSFFAMVGVVDQFSQLRNALGSVLGLFGLVRWLKDVISGKGGGGQTMGGEFRDFVNGKPVLPLHGASPNATPPPKVNKKPLIVFLLAIFGIPYAMHKLIKILSERAAAQQQQNSTNTLPPLDPSQLQFARALYPFQASNPNELSLKENDIVAIMAKLDPRTGMEVDPRVLMQAEQGESGIVEGEWWKGRTREGREGWFPRKWVEVLERRTAEAKKID